MKRCLGKIREHIFDFVYFDRYLKKKKVDNPRNDRFIDY